MATEVTIAICTDSYWGATGNYAGKGGSVARDAYYEYHYTSLDAMLDAQVQDLVSNDRYINCEIVGDDWSSADTTQCEITTSWTTDATHYIKIQALGAARCNGVWSTSRYRLYSNTATESQCLKTSVGHVIIDGIQIHRDYSTSSRTSAFFTVNATGSNQLIQVKNCIIRGGRYSVRVEGTHSVAFTNCIIYGAGTGGLTTVNSTSIATLYHCIVIGPTNGVYCLAGYIRAVNSYACATSGASSSWNDSAENMADFLFHCATAHTSDQFGGNPGVNSVAHSTSTFINVSAGSEDYRLAVGSALRDAGIGMALGNPTAPIVDVSGIIPTTDTACVAVVLTLTSSSTTATFRYRNTDTSAWLTPEIPFTLQVAYSGTTTQIGLASDLHYNYSTTPTSAAAWVDAINDLEDNCGVDEVFVLGDLSGAWADWQDIVDAVGTNSTLGISHYHFIAGNHDAYDTYYDTYWDDAFGTTLSYFEVEIGNAHFICAGTSEEGTSLIGSSALSFINTTLSDNQSEVCFILTHHPRVGTIRTASRDDGTGNGHLNPEDVLNTTLSTYEISAHFCGHCHGWAGTKKAKDVCYFSAADYYATDIAGTTRVDTLDIGAFTYPVAGTRGIGRGVGRGVMRGIR